MAFLGHGAMPTMPSFQAPTIPHHLTITLNSNTTRSGAAPGPFFFNLGTYIEQKRIARSRSRSPIKGDKRGAEASVEETCAPPPAPSAAVGPAVIADPALVMAAMREEPAMVVAAAREEPALEVAAAAHGEPDLEGTAVSGEPDLEGAAARVEPALVVAVGAGVPNNERVPERVPGEFASVAEM